jgi:hypothetical protein
MSVGRHAAVMTSSSRRPAQLALGLAPRLDDKAAVMANPHEE